jgi:8-oxo-dGTP pyrophosphatase MutT (NUDIX family)
MVKVFIDNKAVIFTEELHAYRPGNGNQILVSPDKETLKEAINSFTNDPQQHNLIICGKNTQKIFNRFSSLFLLIEAAGGLVHNPGGQYLFIFRRGYWDLPKGKVEQGESVINAAIREIEEETGISKLNILKSIGHTYHIYEDAGVAILKKTFWFDILCTVTRTPVPQKCEEIEHAKWLDKSDIPDIIMNKTYASIKEMLEQYFKNAF